jgi:hypothetical protein
MSKKRSFYILHDQILIKFTEKIRIPIRANGFHLIESDRFDHLSRKI